MQLSFSIERFLPKKAPARANFVTRVPDITSFSQLGVVFEDVRLVTDSSLAKNNDVVMFMVDGRHYLLGDSHYLDSSKATGLVITLTSRYVDLQVKRSTADVVGWVRAKLRPVSGATTGDDAAGLSEAWGWLRETTQLACSVTASDIHISVVDGAVVVMFRIDGVVVRQKIELDQAKLELIMRSAFNRAANNTNSTSQLEFNEFHQANIPVPVIDSAGKQRQVYLRLTSNPKFGGVKQVMRVLMQTSRGPREIKESGLTLEGELAAFGLAPDQAHLVSLLVRRQGSFLAIGETGSGKTTLLYTVLSHLATPDVVISTLEDPVEGKLYGVDQYSVTPNSGEDESEAFERVWKSMMRSDNDVILFGEIRTRASAQAWLSGSQSVPNTFTTLHAKNWLDAYSRLSGEAFAAPLDILTAPGMISGIAHMSLVQKLCSCADLAKDVLDVNRLEQLSQLGNISNVRVKHDAGCDHCRDKTPGVRGRLPAVGLFVPDHKVNELLASRRFGDATHYIRSRWLRSGMSVADALAQESTYGMSGQEIAIRAMLDGRVDPTEVEMEFGPFELYLRELNDGRD